MHRALSTLILKQYSYQFDTSDAGVTLRKVTVNEHHMNNNNNSYKTLFSNQN